MSLLDVNHLRELPFLEEPVIWDHLITVLDSAFREYHEPPEKQLELLPTSFRRNDLETIVNKWLYVDAGKSSVQT